MCDFLRKYLILAGFLGNPNKNPGNPNKKRIEIFRDVKNG
jgi:hypothetical protein